MEVSGAALTVGLPAPPSASAARSGARPLSNESRDALATALHVRSLVGLSGALRRRTAERIRQLRAADDPSALLVAWWGGSSPFPAPVNGGGNLVAHARRGHRQYVADVVHHRPAEYLRRPAVWRGLSTGSIARLDDRIARNIDGVLAEE